MTFTVEREYSDYSELTFHITGIVQSAQHWTLKFPTFNDNELLTTMLYYILVLSKCATLIKKKEIKIKLHRIKLKGCLRAYSIC